MPLTWASLTAYQHGLEGRKAILHRIFPLYTTLFLTAHASLCTRTEGRKRGRKRKEEEKAITIYTEILHVYAIEWQAAWRTEEEERKKKRLQRLLERKRGENLRKESSEKACTFSWKMPPEVGL